MFNKRIGIKMLVLTAITAISSVWYWALYSTLSATTIVGFALFLEDR